MIPLAVSGPTVIAVAVSGALVLVALVLRAENRDEAREKAERDRLDDRSPMQ
jgi:hypothetical protein